MTEDDPAGEKTRPQEETWKSQEKFKKQQEKSRENPVQEMPGEWDETGSGQEVYETGDHFDPQAIWEERNPTDGELPDEESHDHEQDQPS